MAEKELAIKKNKSVVATNIVMRRNLLRLSGMELAEKANIPYPTLRDIEADISAGRPKTLAAIAKALGCSLEDLYLKESDTSGIEELAEVIVKLKKELLDLKKLNQRLQEQLDKYLPYELLQEMVQNIPRDVLELFTRVYPKRANIIDIAIGYKSRSRFKSKRSEIK